MLGQSSVSLSCGGDAPELSRQREVELSGGSGEWRDQEGVLSVWSLWFFFFLSHVVLSCLAYSSSPQWCRGRRMLSVTSLPPLSSLGTVLVTLALLCLTGIFSEILKDRLDFKQVDVALIGSFGSTGLYMVRDCG